MSTRSDIIVIGGGIAGAAAAYELAAFASVVVLERERQCGYHATGRSAASFTENYGTPVIRRLAKASRAFLAAPPDGFCDHPLLTPRGMITIARPGQTEALAAELDRARRFVPTMAVLDPDEAVDRVPILRREVLAGAIVEPGCMDIDVDGLHGGFLRSARRRGARIVVDAPVAEIGRAAGDWIVTTPAGSFTAPTVVNAAGAWADAVAVMADVRPLGLVPKRRTAFVIPPPEGHAIAAWPMINAVDETFYFKPDAGRLFVSPGDATPSEAVDAVPDDLDVAIGVDRLEAATTVTVRRVSHAWAGLRTFATDGSPVVGPDPATDRFVWLAGQGGYGIKTAPALARACAALIRHRRLPDDLMDSGLDLSQLSPDRFTRDTIS